MAGGTCVLVGDDEAFLREAEALAVQHLGCKLFTGREAYEMSSHQQDTYNRLRHDQHCRATLHLLTDMELLAHTDYFVGAACLRHAAMRGSSRHTASRLLSRGRVHGGRVHGVHAKIVSYTQGTASGMRDACAVSRSEVRVADGV